MFLPQYLRCFIAFFKFAGLIDWTPEVMYFFNCFETYPIVFIPLIRLYEPIIFETIREDLSDLREWLLCGRCGTRRSRRSERERGKAV